MQTKRSHVIFFQSLLFGNAVLGVNYNEALRRDFAQEFQNDKTSISDAVPWDQSIGWSSYAVPLQSHMSLLMCIKVFIW